MDISILIPSIRVELWPALLESISQSFSGKWEVIFVGPKGYDRDLSKYSVTYIKDYASPMVCRQRALIDAQGEYICYAADDVLFCKDSLDEAWMTLMHKDYKTLVVGKYAEGEGMKMVNDNRYWHLNHHAFLWEVMNRFPDYYLINTGLVTRKLMLEIGGWDCEFEACAMGCVDLSMRLQNYGAKCILQNNPIFFSTHLHGYAGDHGPIHEGQTEHDMPLFLKIWNNEKALKRNVIDINNYISQPAVWARRFGCVN